MAYKDFKDLTRRTVSNKFLRDKALNIVKNPKYDEYQKGFTSMVYKFSDKKSASGSGVDNNEIKQNLQLVEELHKPTNFQKRTVYSSFKDTNLDDMQLVKKLNKGFRFLLCVIGIFSKYT